MLEGIANRLLEHLPGGSSRRWAGAERRAPKRNTLTFIFKNTLMFLKNIQWPMSGLRCKKSGHLHEMTAVYPRRLHSPLRCVNKPSNAHSPTRRREESQGPVHRSVLRHGTV